MSINNNNNSKRNQEICSLGDREATGEKGLVKDGTCQSITIITVRETKRSAPLGIGRPQGKRV